MGRATSRRSPGDGALFYRADRDRWIGRVTIDGEHRTVSAKSKTEARKELDLLRRAAEDGLPLTEGSMTLADLLTVWTEKALPNRPLADSAITSHKWAIKILIEELGNVKSTSAHTRPGRGSVPPPNQDDRRRQAPRPGSNLGLCAVAQLAHQDPVDAEPSPQVGAAPQPHRPQRREPGRNPRRGGDTEIGKVADG